MARDTDASQAWLLLLLLLLENVSDTLVIKGCESHDMLRCRRNAF